MTTSSRAVSAIMPARDDAAHLPAAVASVLAQDHPGGVELVIAVGPSSDGTDLVARELAADPRVTVVANPAGGTAAGLNRALAAATGEIIVRVDAHCELPAGYVRRAVTTLERTGAANVGGVQDAVGETPFQRAVARKVRSDRHSTTRSSRGCPPWICRVRAPSSNLTVAARSTLAAVSSPSAVRTGPG